MTTSFLFYHIFRLFNNIFSIYKKSPFCRDSRSIFTQQRVCRRVSMMACDVYLSGGTGVVSISCRLGRQKQNSLNRQHDDDSGQDILVVPFFEQNQEFLEVPDAAANEHDAQEGQNTIRHSHSTLSFLDSQVSNAASNEARNHRDRNPLPITSLNALPRELNVRNDHAHDIIKQAHNGEQAHELRFLHFLKTS